MKTIAFSVLTLFISAGTSSLLSSLMPQTFSVHENVIALKKRDDTPKPVRGIVRGVQDDVLSGATVILRPHGSGTTLDTKLSDVNGEFSFGNYALGSYDLYCSAGGYRDTMVTASVTGDHGINVSIFMTQ